jgi:NADH dehydrogenase FAD-containing subunit
VIVGAGFAGYRTARTPARLTRHKADITLLHPTDYFLYLPLLPRAAAGILESRRVTTLTYDRLVLAVGGVNKLLPVPDPYVQVPGRPEVFACGDAAVPDLERAGRYTPMTAQHAWRYRRVAGRNVAASLGIRSRRAHRDLGFTVGLGRAQAAANRWASRCPAPSPGPSPAALDTASPEPARAAGSPGDFASRPEGES